MKTYDYGKGYYIPLGPKGPGFESWLGHFVISLRKIFTINFIGLPSAMVTIYSKDPF